MEHKKTVIQLGNRRLIFIRQGLQVLVSLITNIMNIHIWGSVIFYKRC